MRVLSSRARVPDANRVWREVDGAYQTRVPRVSAVFVYSSKKTHGSVNFDI